MSKQIAESTERVSFSVGNSTLDKFDQLADERGMNRSELLRTLMQRELDRAGDDSGEFRVPEDDDLAEYYRQLATMAEEVYSGAGLRVTKAKAVNELYDSTLPKDAVMDQVIRPLRKRGWVDIDPAMSRVWITVLPLQRRDADPEATGASEVVADD